MRAEGERRTARAEGEDVSRKDSRKFLDHQRQLRSEMRSDANERWWRTTTVAEEGRRTTEGARRTERGDRGQRNGGGREAGEVTKVEEEA